MYIIVKSSDCLESGFSGIPYRTEVSRRDELTLYLGLLIDMEIFFGILISERYITNFSHCNIFIDPPNCRSAPIGWLQSVNNRLKEWSSCQEEHFTDGSVTLGAKILNLNTQRADISGISFIVN